MEQDYYMVVGFVLGMAAMWLLQQLLRPHRARKDENEALHGGLEEENGRQVREIDELHERLAVLERIATDPAERTAREIEQLR